MYYLYKFKDVTLTGLRFYISDALFFSPLNTETGKTAAVIPADGEWHTLTFDLDQLRQYGLGLSNWSNDALQNVSALRLCFAGENASVLVDDFRFAPAPQEGGNAGVLQRLIARIIELVEKIKAFFTGLFNR